LLIPIPNPFIIPLNPLLEKGDFYHLLFKMKQTKPVGRASVPAIFSALCLLLVNTALKSKNLGFRRQLNEGDSRADLEARG
jgi:hypothetical protein